MSDCRNDYKYNKKYPLRVPGTQTKYIPQIPGVQITLNSNTKMFNMGQNQNTSGN